MILSHWVGLVVSGQCERRLSLIDTTLRESESAIAIVGLLVSQAVQSSPCTGETAGSFSERSSLFGFTHHPDMFFLSL